MVLIIYINRQKICSRSFLFEARYFLVYNWSTWFMLIIVLFLHLWSLSEMKKKSGHDELHWTLKLLECHFIIVIYITIYILSRSDLLPPLTLVGLIYLIFKLKKYPYSKNILENCCALLDKSNGFIYVFKL